MGGGADHCSSLGRVEQAGHVVLTSSAFSCWRPTWYLPSCKTNHSIHVSWTLKYTKRPFGIHRSFLIPFIILFIPPKLHNDRKLWLHYFNNDANTPKTFSCYLHFSLYLSAILEYFDYYSWRSMWYQYQPSDMIEYMTTKSQHAFLDTVNLLSVIFTLVGFLYFKRRVAVGSLAFSSPM